MNKERIMKLAIIADDFTGSNDTAVQFAKKGLRTVVTTNITNIPPSLMENDIVVFDTESRFDDANTAYEKSNHIALAIKQHGVQHIYKKIDSTFRGNIGAELAAVMDGFDCNLLILIPALPSNHRITKDGHVFVHGQALHETEVAKDPKTPVAKSFIPHIIAEQSTKKTKVISKHHDAYVIASVLQQIETAKNAGEEILIFDADTLEDLEVLALSISKIDNPCIVAGTAGLAEFLPQAYQLIEQKPMLAIMGSVSQVTRAQALHAQAQGKLDILDLDMEKLFDTDYQQQLIKRAIHNIHQGRNTAIYSAKDMESVMQNTSHTDICDDIVKTLAQITKSILDESLNKIHCLFVTGGDTLIHIGNELNIAGMNIKDEILPAIPTGYFIHDDYGGIRIITKAGAFGEKDALEKIIDNKDAM